MKLFTNLIAIAIILSVAALMIIAGYHGISYMRDAYMGLEYVVRVLITVGVTVILLGALIVAAGFRVGSRIQAKSQLSAVRHELYATVIDHYRMAFEALRQGQTKRRNEALEALRQMDTDLALLAGGPSLRAHGRLMEAIASAAMDQKRLDHLLLDLARALRRDLGHGYAYEESLLAEMIAPQYQEQAPAGPAASLTSSA